MTQMEQTRLSFTAVRDGNNYIDLTKALTLVNGKHYTQFIKDHPQAFAVVARTVNTANTIRAAPVSWVVRNALVKTAAAWRTMLKKAGISKKDLNTYGKEIRVPLDAYHQATWGGMKRSGLDVVGADLVPDHLTDDNIQNNLEYDTGLCNADDEMIWVTSWATDTSLYGTGDPSGKFREHAFDLTEFTIPEFTDWLPTLIGGTGSVISEYIASRKRSQEQHDDDLDNISEDSDNRLTMMLSDEPEDQMDVIEDTHDLGDFKPYDLSFQNKLVEVIKSGANVAGQDTSFVAPLGLLSWDADIGDELIITVTGQMDM